MLNFKEKLPIIFKAPDEAHRGSDSGPRRSSRKFRLMARTVHKRVPKLTSGGSSGYDFSSLGPLLRLLKKKVLQDLPQNRCFPSTNHRSCSNLHLFFSPRIQNHEFEFNILERR